MNLSSESCGMIYNIQRFSIHDGPGIRTTVFLKGCPLSCFWCHNPESQRKAPDLFFNRDKCTLCGRCIPVCPVKANAIQNGTMLIDRASCTACGTCVEVCQSEARTIMGKRVTVDEVMEVVLKDKSYYRNSGGGVTICGGDAVAQPGFALALMKRCREEGIHTNLDTCGFAREDVFDQLLEYADLVYFDIKCMDPELHQRGTGVDNALILANAIQTAKKRPMHVRVPVIPGFNDNEAEIENIALFARDQLQRAPVDLLKYNKMAESKYLRLDRLFLAERNLPDDETLERRMKALNERVEEVFAQSGC